MHRLDTTSKQINALKLPLIETSGWQEHVFTPINRLISVRRRNKARIVDNVAQILTEVPFFLAQLSGGVVTLALSASPRSLAGLYLLLVVTPNNSQWGASRTEQ